MNIGKKSLFRMIIAAMLVLFMTVGASGVQVSADGNDDGNTPLRADQDAVKIYENAGYKLSVPAEIDELLIVEMPQNDGILFTVSEKLSVETDKAQGGSGDGAGRLFSIGALSEIQLYDMLCSDMSGIEIFARDDAGIYYAYYHPTDVRVVRENYEDRESLAQWSMLNEWAWGEVRDTFIRENNGFTPETYSNSALAICLARAAYGDNVQYTLSSPEAGSLVPDGVYAAPYAMRLIRNVKTETTDAAAPDGEYIVLDFPDDRIRFDFFTAEGSRNLVRQVWSGNEQLFELALPDSTTAAADIMQEWVDALLAADSMRELGYTPDDFIGSWSEKFDGNGRITVEKGAKGSYDIRIERPREDGKIDIWEMTGRPAGDGGILYYEYGKHIIRTDGSEEYSDNVQYENGTGRLTLNSAFEIMWQDDVDHAGDNAVFVNEG